MCLTTGWSRCHLKNQILLLWIATATNLLAELILKLVLVGIENILPLINQIVITVLNYNLTAFIEMLPFGLMVFMLVQILAAILEVHMM